MKRLLLSAGFATAFIAGVAIGVLATRGAFKPPRSVTPLYERNLGSKLHRELASADAMIRREPRNAVAHHQRAWALHMMGDADGALASYDEALRLNPAYSEARTNRLGALLTARRYQETLTEAEGVLEANPRDAYALCARASALECLGRKDEAKIGFLRALEEDSGLALAHEGLARFYISEGLFEEAESHVQEILKLDSGDAYHWGLAGHLAACAHDWTSADQHYENAIQIDPSYVDALIGRADALAELLQHQQAMTLIERALDLDPGSADALAIRAHIQFASGRTELAISDYRAALVVAPPDWEDRAWIEEWLRARDSN